MACTISLDLLEKQIAMLKKELESKIDPDISNLSSSEVLQLNNVIDKLLVSYIKLSVK